LFYLQLLPGLELACVESYCCWFLVRRSPDFGHECTLASSASPTSKHARDAPAGRACSVRACRRDSRLAGRRQPLATPPLTTVALVALLPYCWTSKQREKGREEGAAGSRSTEKRKERRVVLDLQVERKRRERRAVVKRRDAKERRGRS